MGNVSVLVVLCFALCAGLAFASPKGTDDPSQPKSCSKILLGDPVAESLVEELDVTALIKNVAVRNVTLSLDPSPLPTAREYENNLLSLQPIHRTAGLLRNVVEKPQSEAAQKFRKKANLDVHAARRKITPEAEINNINRRFERALNLGLRVALGNAKMAPDTESRLFGVVLDEASAFLAVHGVSHTITSRTPDARIPRVEDLFINLYTARGQYVGKYDPIEVFKNLHYVRRTQSQPDAIAEAEVVVTPLAPEARIKRINEMLEASRLRIVKQLDHKIADQGYRPGNLDVALESALKLYRAERLKISVERLPEKSPYQFNGKTVQPGHYVLRFDNAASKRVEFRVFSAEQLK